MATKPAINPSIRRSSVLAAQVIDGNDGFGMGKPLRRLRQMLPQQARGGGDRPHLYTDVGCRLLDGETCRCRDYKHRQEQVDDCVRLTPRNLKTITWLPPSCAYVLVAEGRDLYWWHPLVSGDPETVHTAGVSVRGRVGASEVDVPDEDLEDHIVSWPLKLPKAARRKTRHVKAAGRPRSPALRKGLLQCYAAAGQVVPA